MIPARIAALAIMLAVASSAAAQDHGIPVPDGARRNTALGGATTLATGKNYTIIVYDVDSPLASVSEFYASRLPDAKPMAQGEEIRYQTNEGAIRIVRLGAGTRITLSVGPR